MKVVKMVENHGGVPIHFKNLITYFYLETCKRIKGKQCRSDPVPHNAASDQGLNCLLTGFSIKNRIKATKQTRHS